MLTEREHEARIASRKKHSFDAWMREPMTRMAISLIPAGDRQDALMALLETAFWTGFNAGSASSAINMVQAIVERKMRRDE